MYKKFGLSKAELKHLYWDMQLTAKEVAEKLGVHFTTVYKWMKRYGIPIRDRSEGRKLVWINQEKRRNYIQGMRKHGKESRKFKLERDDLYHLYLVEGLNQTQIAKKFGVSKEIVRRRLIEYNVLPIKGRKKGTREFSEKLSEIMKQRWKNPEYRKKMVKVIHESLKKYKGVHRSPHTEFKRGHKTDNSTREKIRKAVQKKYQEDPELLKRVLSCQKPNEAEKTLINLFRKYSFPFRYVGDGQVVIDGKVPDFIATDGSAMVIELFGVHWHDPAFEVNYDRTKEGRERFFKSRGYGCLILWDDELGAEVEVVEKINNFMGGLLS